MELRLRPATKDELDQYLPHQEAEYARLIAESGSMPLEAAKAKARIDLSRVYRDVGTPGQLIFRLIADGEPAGWLWLAVPHGPDDPLMVWVNDIEVDPGYQGRGLGRQAMLLAEQEARARGMTSIGLNVHGQNTVAIALYGSLGYHVMTQQMKKPL